MIKRALAAPLVALVTLAAAVAAAQTASTIPNATAKSTGWTIQFAHPNAQDDGGIIDCTFGEQGGCRTFNRAVCTDPNASLPIEISVTAQSPQTGAAGATNVTASMWLQANNTTCTLAPDADPNSVKVLATSNGYLPTLSTFLGGTNAFTVPGPLSSRSTFAMSDIMAAFPAICDPNGVPLTPFKLCFGADTNLDGVVGTAISANTQGTDPTGYFEFPVDTVAPPLPTLTSATSLVGRVTIAVAYDTAGQDTAFVDVLSTEATDAAMATSDCGTWPSPTVSSQDVRFSGTGIVSVDVPGRNGQLYAYCIRARDYLDNPSATSPIVTASPHAECDFIGCYPEDLDVGYCGAGLGPAAALAAAAAARRAVRRRRTPPRRS